MSTAGQDSRMQIDALKKKKSKRIFHDRASGVKSNRDGQERALEFMRGGDTRVVWNSDRLSRSLRQLKDIMNLLKEKGMNIKSLQESIDTRSYGGKLKIHLFDTLAELEREMRSDRTIAGIAAAKKEAVSTIVQESSMRITELSPCR